MLPQNLMHPGAVNESVSVLHVSSEVQHEANTMRQKASVDTQTHTYLAQFKEGSPELSTGVTLDVTLQILLVFLAKKSQH